MGALEDKAGVLLPIYRNFIFNETQLHRPHLQFVAPLSAEYVLIGQLLNTQS
jgi:hypothetical protein